MPENGRPAYIGDLNELRDWIDERLDHLRDEQAADLQQLRDDIRRVTDDHEQRLRELEQTRWRLAGWAAGVGSLVSVSIAWLKDRLAS